MAKLNLGCGQNKEAGFINVDKYDSFKPDVVWDLEVFPWPFEESSAEEVLLNHCLEHLGADTETFLGIMKEIYRVSAPNARVRINVPHPRSYGFDGDPTHVRKVNPEVLSLFSMANNRKFKELGWPNTPLATYLKIDLETTNVEFRLTQYWMEKLQKGEMTNEEMNHAANTYFNVIDEIKFELKAIKPWVN